MPELVKRSDLAALVPARMVAGRSNRRASRRLSRSRIVIEAAHGPTPPAADDTLRERGILAVPDVIAYADGVTVSYSEWVQDFFQLLPGRACTRDASLITTTIEV